jgi:hypothetical protein
MTHIFVSYRSTDVPYAAALLDNALKHEFGAERVFRDSRSLRPGDEFDPEIMRAVRESAALLVVIGPRWVGETDAKGRRQIDNPNDFIHRELVEAYAHDVRVVPVLVGTDLLKAADLPADLSFLAERQYRILRMRESDADVRSLITALAETLPGFTVREPAASSGHTIRADKVGAVFNESVRVDGDFNIG